MEVQYLRDYYVNTAVKNPDPTIDYDFFTQKRYEQQFLPLIEQKFNIKTPSIVGFFKQKFLYDFDIPDVFDKKCKVTGDNYMGYCRKGKVSTELPVSEELREMQACLDFLSTNPRMTFAMESDPRK